MGVQHKLGERVDGASLAFFRIAFGGTLAFSAIGLLDTDLSLLYASRGPLNFTYLGFDWVRPPGIDGPYYLWGSVGVLGILLAIGAYYRLTATALAVSLWWIFLMEGAKTIMGDLQPLSSDLMDEVTEVTGALTKNQDWETGDVLMIDNRRVMHGRREILDPEREDEHRSRDHQGRVVAKR